MAKKTQIFPHEIMDYTVEKFFHQYSSRSRVIYLVVLLLFFAGLLLLFVVKVDISVQGSGMIKPVQERAELRAAMQGIVDSMYVTENSPVKAGQPILKIRSQAVEEKKSALGFQQSELEAQLADLKKLVAGNAKDLQSELYQQQYIVYRQKMGDAQSRYNIVQKTYSRYLSLYKQKVIAAAEFERYQYERTAVANEVELIRQQQQELWQSNLTRLSLQLNEVQAQGTQFEEEAGLYVLKAPVSGTVQQLKGLQPGSAIAVNDILGEISPDSGLVAEAYVLPKDIGMVKEGMPVRLQVEAFNYNQWGMAMAKVISISGDAFTENGVPYFKVRCKLDRTSLQLSNGYKGHLKKGMTLQARFIVTRRSLFQLLYDKTSDWLSPVSPKK